LRGEGVSQNAETGFELFSLAAEQGIAGARIKLGYLYMTGRGTRKDDEAAYAWIKAAALGGDPPGAGISWGAGRAIYLSAACPVCAFSGENSPNHAAASPPRRSLSARPTAS